MEEEEVEEVEEEEEEKGEAVQEIKESQIQYFVSIVLSFTCLNICDLSVGAVRYHKVKPLILTSNHLDLNLLCSLLLICLRLS